MPGVCLVCDKSWDDCRCHADDPTVPIPLEQSPPRMKPAREVAREAVGCTCEPDEPHSVECEEASVDLGRAIEAARREAAEWMREQAAKLASDSFDDGDGCADAIRDLPLEPKP